MSLPHALLTALLEHPCSGLELAARFERSIGYFWHATHQQIYRELARMEGEGWISGEATGEGRGGKKRYQVLAAGRRELKAWASREQDPAPHREALMVRLRAEAVLGGTRVAEELQRRLALHQGQLAHYQALEARDFLAEGSPDDRAARIHHLILKAGIQVEQLWVDWCAEALAVLAEPAPAAAKRRR